jgi:outer membrane lipoprotein-sorting protein
MGMTRSRVWATVLFRTAVATALLLCVSPLRAADAAPTGTELTGEERVRAIERLQARQREVSALRAAVVQKKHHPLLKGEVVSEGTLLFKRPDHLWWETTRPEHTIIVIDGHALHIYRPERKEVERRALRDDFGSRAAAEFLTAGMNLAVAELEKRFQVDLYRDDGRLTLWLTPRSRWVAQVIASIAITQEDGDALPRQIVVVGAKGDRTETSLTQVVVNPQLPEDAFALKLGPEVRVVDVRMPAGDRDSGR